MTIKAARDLLMSALLIPVIAYPMQTRQFDPNHPDLQAEKPWSTTKYTVIGGILGGLSGLGWAAGTALEGLHDHRLLLSGMGIWTSLGVLLGYYAAGADGLRYKNVYNMARGKNIYGCAAEGNKEGLLAWSTNRFGFGEQDNKGRTILHYAAGNGNSETVDEILNMVRWELKSEFIDLKDKEQNAALHYALLGAHMKTAAALKTHGADESGDIRRRAFATIRRQELAGQSELGTFRTFH